MNIANVYPEILCLDIEFQNPIEKGRTTNGEISLVANMELYNFCYMSI